MCLLSYPKQAKITFIRIEKTNVSDQKPYMDRDKNKNPRMWIRIQKAPGYVSKNILIQNQFARRS